MSKYFKKNEIALKKAKKDSCFYYFWVIMPNLGANHPEARYAP